MKLYKKIILVLFKEFNIFKMFLNLLLVILKYYFYFFAQNRLTKYYLKKVLYILELHKFLFNLCFLLVLWIYSLKVL